MAAAWKAALQKRPTKKQIPRSPRRPRDDNVSDGTATDVRGAGDGCRLEGSATKTADEKADPSRSRTPIRATPAHIGDPGSPTPIRATPAHIGDPGFGARDDDSGMRA